MYMHTMWKGAVSFGLVHVPVKMFSATEDKDISMRMIHKPCGTPVSYIRRCATCESDVAWEDIVKGYEYDKGHFVLFNKEELEALNGEANKEIKILDFVDITEIDPVYFQKTYYLAPSDTGSNAYSLLLQALSESGKIGIAQVSIRSKSSLAAVRVVEGCLAMETIFYPDEIRPIAQVPNLPEQATVDEKELTMAKMLIDQLTVPFEPEKYQDETRQRIMEAIESKIAGEEVQAAPNQPATNVADLMSALQASLAAVQTDPGKDSSSNKRKSAPAKKNATKKAVGAEADKPAAKKRTTKSKTKKDSS